MTRAQAAVCPVSPWPPSSPAAPAPRSASVPRQLVPFTHAAPTQRCAGNVMEPRGAHLVSGCPRALALPQIEQHRPRRRHLLSMARHAAAGLPARVPVECKARRSPVDLQAARRVIRAKLPLGATGRHRVAERSLLRTRGLPMQAMHIGVRSGRCPSGRSNLLHAVRYVEITLHVQGLTSKPCIRPARSGWKHHQDSALGTGSTALKRTGLLNESGVSH